ncbi:MAG: GNAT family N-acetyltransferase [Hellea sp.]|nr:GNAT family N-acetyltransferase [Hellea sp.]
MRDIIHSERLVLRDLELSDAERFSKFTSDWEIARMTGSIPHPMPVISTEIKILTMRSQRRRGLAYPYAITLDGRDIIGVMDLFRRSDTSDHELGYWVARPYWGLGYAKEAGQAFIREAVKSLKISKIVAGVFADNPASMRVLRSLGFKNIGSEGDFFSMARLGHMESIGFELDLTAPSAKSLHQDGGKAIEAC